MTVLDEAAGSSSDATPISPYISAAPFLSPSSSSSPASYTSFTSPVSHSRYFACLSGLSVLILDSSLALLTALDLSPHLATASPDSSAHPQPQPHSLAVSNSQQLAVACGHHVLVFCLILTQHAANATADSDDSTQPATSDVPITARLITGGEEEEDGIHAYNAALASAFQLSHFASISAPHSVTALSFRTVSPYHMAELLISGTNWLALHVYDKPTTQYRQTWQHSNTHAQLFPAPSGGNRRQALSQPSTPASPGPLTIAGTHSAITSHLALSHDSRVLALLSHHPSTTLALYNLDTATRRCYQLAHPTPLLSFSFCPNTPHTDNLLATLCTDGVIRFWRQNKLKPTVGTSPLSLAHLSPLTPAVVSEKSMAHSISAEFSNKTSLDGNSTGLTKAELAHTHSVPQALNVLKGGKGAVGWKGRGGLGADEDEEEEDVVQSKDAMLEPEVLQDQPDVDWYVCCELELSGSGGAQAAQRNGYMSMMWINESLTERSVLSTVSAAQVAANLMHALQKGNTATPPSFAILTASTAGLIAPPPTPAPRLLTVDREGTLQVWYMRDILSNPRTNCTPLPLLTLYHQLPSLYLHPWLYTVNDVSVMDGDELVRDTVVRGWAGMEDGVVMRMTLVMKRETDDGSKTAGERKARGWIGQFQVERVIGGHNDTHFRPERLLLATSSSSRHVSSLSAAGQLLLWSADDSHLLLPSPGGSIQYAQQLVREGGVAAMWVKDRLVSVDGEGVEVWGWDDSHREWQRKGREEYQRPLDGTVAAVDEVPAVSTEWQGQHIVLICTGSSISMLAIREADKDDELAVRWLQQVPLPTDHSSAALTSAVVLPSYSTTAAEERILVAYGSDEGDVTLLSLSPSSSTATVLTHFTAHTSKVVSIKAASVCHLVTQSEDDSIRVWESISHLFSYQLLHTLPAPTPPPTTVVSAYFSQHAVTSVRSTTPTASSSSAHNKQSKRFKSRRCFDVVDEGDGQVHVVTGDAYGQLRVYRPTWTGWGEERVEPFVSGLSLVAVCYSPHTLGVVVVGWDEGKKLPLLRHVHLSTVLSDKHPLLPIYHPRLLEEDVMRGAIARVKNVLADLVEQVLNRPLSDAVKLTNVPIKQVLLKDDKTATAAADGSAAAKAAASNGDSGQISMGSFGGGFGGFGGGGFGGGGFGGSSFGSSSTSSSSLTPAITTYTRPTAELQADPSSRELTALVSALRTKRLPYLRADAQEDLCRLIAAVQLIVEQEKQLDEFAQRYIFAATLYRARNPYPVEQEPEDDKPTPPPYAQLLAALPTLSTHAIAYGYHSSSIETILSLTTGSQSTLPLTGLSWDVCRQLGLGYFLRGAELSATIEAVAKAQFAVSKNPNDCFLFYLALGKKSVLLGLMRQNSKYEAVFQFMSQDFDEQDNRTAASKNAFRALTKRKYELAAGFFLLAGMLSDAVNMCFRHMNDPQLAIVLCRLVEGENSPLLRQVVKRSMIPFAEEKRDVYIEYFALQLLKRQEESVYALLSASGREGDVVYHASTASFLRLVDHSKSRLYTVPRHLVSAAQRKSAATYARLGMGVLALEEYPTEDVIPPPRDKTQPAASPTSATTVWSAPASGQVAFGSGFGSFGGGGFGMGNSSTGQVATTSGFGQANPASGQVSMTGGFGGGCFGPSSANTGQVSMTGGFGQSSFSSGQVSMAGGFGQPTANASSGSLGGSFGSFGSFGSPASAASSQLAMGGGFGQPSGANANSGSLSGSFGSFGSAPSPVPAAASPAPFNLGSFGSFGMSAAPAITAKPAAQANGVAAEEEDDKSRAVDATRPQHVTDAAHTQYLQAVRQSFVQQAVQQFLTSRVPFTQVNSNTDEAQGIIADVLVLQQLHSFNPTLAVQGLTAYTLLHRLYNSYLALSIQTHFTSSPVTAAGPFELPHTLDQFLLKELTTFASLLSHTSFHLVSAHQWDQVAAVYRQLLAWRTCLATPQLGKRRGSSRGEWHLLSCLIHSSLLLWAVREKDYVTVMSTLEVRFAGTTVHEVVGLKEKEADEARRRQKEEEEKRQEEGDIVPLDLPPLPSAATIDLFSSVKQRLSSLAQLLYLHAVIAQHHKNFYATFLDHDLNSSAAPALAAFNAALLLALDTLSALTHSALKHSMRRLSYYRADYEYVDADDSSVRQFPFQDTLQPLLEPHFPYGSTMLSFLELEPLLPRIGREMSRYFEVENERSAGSILVHAPLDVFRVSEKGGDTPACVCIAPVQGRYIVVGGGFGMREVNVQSVLRWRERKDGALVGEEERSWERVLHRYQKMEKEAANEGGHTFPRPRSLVSFALDGRILTVSASSSALINSRVYDDFTSASTALSSPTSSIDRDSSTSYLTAHPSLPLYLSITNNRLLLWHYALQSPLVEFSPRSSSRSRALDKGEHLTRVRFNGSGNKLAACTDMGRVLVWVFQMRSVGMPRAAKGAAAGADGLYAYDVFDAHTRRCEDVVWLDAGNFIATCGDSSSGMNVCVYSLLLPAEERLIVAFKTHDGSAAGAGGGGVVGSSGGGASLAYIPTLGVLACGGMRGGISLCDLTTKSVSRRLELTRIGSSGGSGGSSRVHRLVWDGSSGWLWAANQEGVLRVFDANRRWAVVGEWTDWYAKGGLMSGGWGVSDIAVSGLHAYISGSDGSVRYLRKKRGAMQVKLEKVKDKGSERRGTSTRR